LKAIERATRQPVSPLELPTIQTVNNVRIARFKDQISTALAEGGLDEYTSLIEDYEREHNIPAIEIAAALAKMARGDEPLLLDKNRKEVKSDDSWRDERPARNERNDRGDRPGRDRGDRFEREDRGVRREHSPRTAEPGMQTYRIAVGHEHGVKPGNIVGAIANEANIESKFIGRIDIYDDYTILDLPDDLPADMLDHLKSVRVAGQSLRISAEKAGGSTSAPVRSPRSEPRAERTERAPRIADAAPGSRMNQVVERAFSAPDEDDRPAKPKKEKASKGKVSVPMQTYRIEVGKADTVTPANIVGAIANEAGMEAKYIGRIDIFDNHSTLDLPVGMPPELLAQLKGVWVAGKQIKISPVGEPTSGGVAHDFPAGQKKSGGDRRVLEKAAGKPGARSDSRSDSKPAGKFSNGRPSKFDKDSGTTRRKPSK